MWWWFNLKKKIMPHIKAHTHSYIEIASCLVLLMDAKIIMKGKLENMEKRSDKCILRYNMSI